MLLVQISIGEMFLKRRAPHHSISLRFNFRKTFPLNVVLRDLVWSNVGSNVTEY